MVLNPSPDRSPPPIDLVVVGAASRDLAPDDPRGWRLGGAVLYGGLAAARLGLRVAAVIGADAEAAVADELQLLRDAGGQLAIHPLAHGPVFDNREGPEGRIQLAHDVSAAVPPEALPESWSQAGAWLFGPVAGELADAWAAVPSGDALVALGWQGLLREVRAGEEVRRVPPSPSALLARADLVGVSADDLAAGTGIAELCALLRPGATLLVTGGDGGGLVVDAGPEGPRGLSRYPALTSDGVVDPTGAGDVFLAAVLSARAQPRLVGGRIGQRFDLLLAAAVASLTVEAPGLAGVPTREAVRRRMTEAAGRRTGAREAE